MFLNRTSDDGSDTIKHVFFQAIADIKGWLAACQFVNGECGALKSNKDYENLTSNKLGYSWKGKKSMSWV